MRASVHPLRSVSLPATRIATPPAFVDLRGHVTEAYRVVAEQSGKHWRRE